MKTFLKATALLSSTLSRALVLPNVAAYPVPPADPIVEYDPHVPFVRFVINSVAPSWGYPILNFEVSGTDRACGESYVQLDGHNLSTVWNGIYGLGSGQIAAYGQALASWNVSCLYNSVPSDGSNSQGEDIVHVLSLQVADDRQSGNAPAFTVSYKQSANPIIHRLAPSFEVAGNSDEAYEFWRQLSPDLAAHYEESADREISLGPLGQAVNQKSLLSSLTSIKQRLGHSIYKALSSLSCHKKKPAQSGHEDSEAEVQHDELDAVISQDTATPVQQHAAAETRSLQTPSSESAISSPTLSDPKDRLITSVVVKSFAISLLLILCLAWIFIFLRDPRRRVDRAARREERQRKRLYKCAAQRQKNRTRIWRLRLFLGWTTPEILEWDEKRRRDEEAEKFDEVEESDTGGTPVQNDIRALRDAHNLVSNLMSRPGRSSSRRSRRPRSTRSMKSVSTLPGYESDEVQPPPYSFAERRRGSEAGCSTELTSDSSIISTSPRISRDGTNSDLEAEEKIEDLALDQPDRAVIPGSTVVHRV